MPSLPTLPTANGNATPYKRQRQLKCFSGYSGERIRTSTDLMPPCPALAALAIGLVCSVTVERTVDGDTFKARFGRELHSVRVVGIDTPERGERGYQEATKAARRTFGRQDGDRAHRRRSQPARRAMRRACDSRPLWARASDGRRLAQGRQEVGQGAMAPIVPALMAICFATRSSEATALVQIPLPT